MAKRHLSLYYLLNPLVGRVPHLHFLLSFSVHLRLGATIQVVMEGLCWCTIAQQRVQQYLNKSISLLLS